jgi:phenylacetate-coenzyme A ligase PaaK-like adenylate-forming protein
LITTRSGGELEWNSANLAFAFDRHLERGVDRVAILHPGILSPFAEACGRALERIGVPFIRVYPVPRVCDYQRLLDVLRRHQVTTVMTTASLALKLLYERGHLAKDERPWGVRRWLLTGELLTPAFMRHASQLADAQVSTFVYGSSEAATCAIGDRDDLYDPCLKDFAFELVPSSESGLFELWLTWLNAGVRPLVRYRTGDVFELRFEGDGAQRQVRMDAYGRADGSVLSARSRREVDELIFGSGYQVYHYELGLGVKQGKLEVVIGSDGLARREACAEALRDDVSELLGRPIEVQVNAPASEFLQFSPSPKSTRFYALREQEPQ